MPGQQVARQGGTQEVVRRVEAHELFENAVLLFRNFEGREGQYNTAGQKNFCVLIGQAGPNGQFIPDHERADRMASQGWNIKQLNPREPGDIPTAYIQVAMGFEFKPPRLVLISSRGRVDLSEEQCPLLDWVDIAKADLIIRPYNWGPIGGRSGVKAYLKSLFITMLEDELELKYSDVPRMQSLEGEPVPLAITTGEPVDTADFDTGDMELVESNDGIFDAELVED